MWIRPQSLNAHALMRRVVTVCLAIIGLGWGPRIPAATDPYSLRQPSSVYDVQTLLTLAEQGDKRAAFLLGTRYAAGRNSTRDDSEALRWFTQAAQAGLAEAQYNLGIMYAQGRGVPRDIKQAIDWYTRAAQQGLATAQFNLGTLYSSGDGVPRDEAKAADWLQRAATKGIAPAQFNLAILYEYGRGVRLNAAQALHWYSEAAELGYTPAVARRRRLERMLELPAVAQTAVAGAAPQPETPIMESQETTQAIETDAAAEVAPEVAATPEAEQAETVVTTPQTVAAASTEAVPVPAETNSSADWLAGLESEHYTLQLASYVDLKAAQQYIDKLDVSASIGIYASTKRGKRWYSVIYGDYAGYQQAQAASRNLPAAFRGIKPWVRKVALIRKEME